MNQIVQVPERNPGEIMESVITKGDLSKLTPEERSRYYGEVCNSVGLNPLTKPFEYITLNGKLQLYALRNCTDQLRQIHKVSVIDMSETERDGLCIVTCKVTDGSGRTDMAKGAVSIANLKGEALANAIMKAETKAKRRATLSLCGLGWLDETEVEDIPDSAKRPVSAAAPASAAIGASEQSAEDLEGFMVRQIEQQHDFAKLNDWCKRHAKAFDRLSSNGQDRVKEAAARRRTFLMDAPLDHDPETGELPADADADSGEAIDVPDNG